MIKEKIMNFTWIYITFFIVILQAELDGCCLVLTAHICWLANLISVFLTGNGWFYFDLILIYNSENILLVKLQYIDIY